MFSRGAFPVIFNSVLKQVHGAVLLVTFVTAPLSGGDDPAAGALAVFETGDYKTAIPQLQAAVAGAQNKDAVRAALLSALVYEGRVDERQRTWRRS